LSLLTCFPVTLRSRLSFRLDAFKKQAGGLVVRVLRHEFAPECLGEDGLVEMIDQLAGAGRFGCKAVNLCECNAEPGCR
jgi:hypothetical protein